MPAHKIIIYPGRTVMRRALIAFIALATLVSPSYAQQSKQPREKPVESVHGKCVTYERCKAYAAKNGFSDAESSNYCSKNCPK
jgi:hypothetical protein